MEITIRIKNAKELNKIKKLLEGEKIKIAVGRTRKLKLIRKINKITEDTFKKTDKGEDLIFCKDVDDFFKKLGI